MQLFEAVRQDKDASRRDDDLRIKDLDRTYKELIRFFQDMGVLNKELKEFIKNMMEVQKREVRSGRGMDTDLSDRHIIISFQRAIEESLRGNKNLFDFSSNSPLIQQLVKSMGGLDKAIANLDKAQTTLAEKLNTLGDKISGLFSGSGGGQPGGGGPGSGVNGLLTPQAQAAQTAQAGNIGKAVAAAMVASPILNKFKNMLMEVGKAIFPFKSTIMDTIKLLIYSFGGWLRERFGPKWAAAGVVGASIALPAIGGLIASRIVPSIIGRLFGGAAASATTGAVAGGLPTLSNAAAKTSLSAGSYFFSTDTGAVRKVIKNTASKTGTATRAVSQKALQKAIASGAISSSATQAAVKTGVSTAAGAGIKGLAKKVAPLAFLMTPFEASAMMKQGYSGGHAWTRAGLGTAGGLAGWSAGASAGAAIGTFVGGPVGTAVGGLLGALTGGFLGTKLGESIADAIWKSPLGKKIDDFFNWVKEWWPWKKENTDPMSSFKSAFGYSGGGVAPTGEPTGKSTGDKVLEVSGIPKSGVRSGAYSPSSGDSIFGKGFTRGSRGFGMQKHPIFGDMRMHEGQDFSAKAGTPIKAPIGGKVVSIGNMGGYGKTVQVDDGAAIHLFAHMSKYGNISKGQEISAGTVVGYVGSTGYATGPHLHYGVKDKGKGKFIDPINYINRVKKNIGQSSGSIPSLLTQDSSATVEATTSSASGTTATPITGEDTVKTAANTSYGSGNGFDITGTEQFNTALNSVRVQLGKFQQIGMIV